MLGFHRQGQLRASTISESINLKPRAERWTPTNSLSGFELSQTIVEKVYLGCRSVQLSAVKLVMETQMGVVVGLWFYMHAWMSFFLALELVKVQCSAGIRGLKKKKSFRVFQVCFPSQIEPLNSNQTTPARPQPPKNGLWTETDAEKHQAIIQQQNIYRQQNDVNVLLPPCHKPYSSFHLVIRVVLA